MTFSESKQNIISFWERKNLFLITYFCFFLGFFVVPSTHWHNNLFYFFVLFPYLVTFTFRTKSIKIFCRSKIWVLSLVLAGYMCLTLLWAQDAVFDDYLYYLRRPLYLFVLLSLTIELVLRYPSFIDDLFVFLCWTAAITGIISIFWFYSAHSFPIARLRHFGDQLQNPVAGASVYGMVAIICYFYVLKREKAHIWIYTGILVVVFSSAILTWSRAPLAALFTSFLIGTISIRDKRFLGIVICVTAICGLMWFYVEGVKETITRPGALRIRMEIWEQTLLRIKEALFFGEGISTDTRFTISDGSIWNHPHNVYLATALYGGLTGFFLFLALVVVGLWQSILCFRREKDVTYVVLLLYALTCMMSGNYRVISHPDAIWIYFWLPLALLAAKETTRCKDICIVA